MDNINLDKQWTHINDILMAAVEYKASDLHISVDLPPMVRQDGQLRGLGDHRLSRGEIMDLILTMLGEEKFREFEEQKEVDFSYSVPGFGRFRINIYHQRGSTGLAARTIPFSTPTLDALGMPETVKQFTRLERGLVIVTGPTGSGKSTTLASMIDMINTSRSRHIITLEDPIEYLHKHNLSMVNQREVGIDTTSFANGLRAALRQDPDVILVGEMRDLETIATAVTAAETGHLVLASLHTTDAPGTIDRIIDVFPPHQQQQIRIQLAATLQGVVAQQLIPRADH
ncbi:MAG TPA: PilT/PilU family type 4a pilus ATPase, partial [Bacillota bacterium]|nr:PilT/PilU family type 4a pilus ATPase [Bacillota bacterium]